MARDWRLYLDDMLDSIDKIERLQAHDLEADEFLGLAFERTFEFLSEASRHVPLEIKSQYDTVRWRDLADLGNILRHAYHRVSIERLLDTARKDVPPLKTVLIEIKKSAASPS